MAWATLMLVGAGNHVDSFSLGGEDRKEKKK